MDVYVCLYSYIMIYLAIYSYACMHGIRIERDGWMMMDEWWWMNDDGWMMKDEGELALFLSGCFIWVMALEQRRLSLLMLVNWVCRGKWRNMLADISCLVELCLLIPDSVNSMTMCEAVFYLELLHLIWHCQ